ncbi:MAG: TRAP transporter small permease [Planctomycetes bacterium]|nr:TRAP transporter small permease [Planctomycetota bacterium]
MKSMLAKLQKVENFVIIITSIVMTLSCFAQVVNRNLIGAGISWFDELARYNMIYLALLGTEIGLRDGSQVAITMVVDKFGGKFRQALEILAMLVIVVFSIVVAWSSLFLLEKQILNYQVSIGLGIPMVIPSAILPITFLIIACTQGIRMLAVIRELFKPGAEKAEGGTR